MKMRPLGSSGIEASVVAFGAWAIGGWQWGGTDDNKAITAIHAAIDSGINFIDTAPVYGFGRSETVVGKALKGRRDKVILATKCGLAWHAEEGELFFEAEDSFSSDGASTARRVYRCLTPESIRYEVEQSLTRLQVDYIDLYQTHWQDPTTPIAETMGELERLQDEGKIRAIGCSNATPKQMDSYRSAGALSVDQELYSMLEREMEATNLPYCDTHSVAFLAYSPLAQGLLTGKVGPDRVFAEGDQRLQKDRFSAENRKVVASFLEELHPFAEAHRATLGQLVIAWTVSQLGCTHALVGARNTTQATENAAAGEIELSSDELNAIRGFIDQYSDRIV